MITRLTSYLLHSGRTASRIPALLGLACLVMLSSARAVVPTVQPNDTFSLGLIAYNTTAASTDFYSAIASSSGQLPVQSTFGTTTFGLGLDGQTLTVTSGQTISNGIVTDTITISVPTNFVPADQATFGDGKVVNALDFTLGVVAGTGGTDTLDFTGSITGAGFTGSGIYTGNGGGTISFAGRQNPVFSNGGTSLSNQEAVSVFDTNGNPASISPYAVRSLTFTITVPEPSTYAAVLLGAAGLCWLTVVRRRARA